jgi:hypothetical protein
MIHREVHISRDGENEMGITGIAEQTPIPSSAESGTDCALQQSLHNCLFYAAVCRIHTWSRRQMVCAGVHAFSQIVGAIVTVVCLSVRSVGGSATSCTLIFYGVWAVHVS